MANKQSIILGIESSCDDTSIAVLKGRKILSNFVANQEIHAEFGGVVPELASRAHQQNIIPVIEKGSFFVPYSKRRTHTNCVG